MSASYLYRCTEQQLEAHLQRVAEGGDIVEHVIYKGGRDYVLVCRQPVERTMTVHLSTDSVEAIAQSMATALNGATRRAVRA